jgi:hypothetical protein
VKRFIEGFVVLSVLFFVGSVGAWAEDAKYPVRRLARLTSQPPETERVQDYVEQLTILPWLDDILTRAPSLQQLMDDSLGRPENEADLEPEAPPTSRPSLAPRADAAPPDGLFPKPPDMQPLYTSPVLEGEGIWTPDGLPADAVGRPLIYRTVYRPSVDFPNSIVYLAIFDLKRIKPRLFIGNTEPGIYQISDVQDNEPLNKIVAITNAMWMQQHSRGAGAIFRGRVVYPMVEGMATLVVFKDDSVDILEWSDDIPITLVRDARQLRHLIVKNGKVVEQVLKGNQFQDPEIGLGGFLVDDGGASTMRNKFWFLANRTAFGVREDGNLVFAMGHHISTKDLARVLALAGCRNAIHGDANIHNLVCNFYFRDERNKVVKRDRLSPEQKKYTMQRYDQGYSKDFFAFYEK